MRPNGLYIHVPFCDGKCPYCDFYSLRADEETMDAYVTAVKRELACFGAQLGRRADTLYFGGGTPSLLGAARLCELADAARAVFGLEGAEITAEVNPCTGGGLDFAALRAGGFNRLSVGLQSANEEELRCLGRRHGAQDAAVTLGRARAAGFANLSLDLMLAIPGQTEESLRRSVRFCREAGARHVSAYLLKLEEGTPFFARRDALALPDEEGQRRLYLAVCEVLGGAGFAQYEISNFSEPGCESRHNLKYWNGEEYLGIGPSAHSFLEGRRFHSPRSLESFLRGTERTDDGTGGDGEEYAMLRLRLCEGLERARYRERFGCDYPASYDGNARRFEKAGLLTCDERGIRLSREGFLVSNELIGEILL